VLKESQKSQDTAGRDTAQRSTSHSAATCCGDSASSLRFMDRRRAFLAAKIACLDEEDADMVGEVCLDASAMETGLLIC
jgi:hypothetical protein